MRPRNSIFRTRVSASTVLLGAVFLAILSFGVAAQTGGGGVRQKPGRARLPRVGTIKDYPATGLMTGCGNGYYYFAHQYGNAPGDNFVFLTNGDGTNAWMNLGGRDARLKLIGRPSKNGKAPFRFLYRWGDVLIDAVFEPFKPPDAPYAEGDPMSKLKITLRRGRARRTVSALGDADC